MKIAEIEDKNQVILSLSDLTKEIIEEQYNHVERLLILLGQLSSPSRNARAQGNVEILYDLYKSLSKMDFYPDPDIDIMLEDLRNKCAYIERLNNNLDLPSGFDRPRFNP